MEERTNFSDTCNPWWSIKHKYLKVKNRFQDSPMSGGDTRPQTVNMNSSVTNRASRKYVINSFVKVGLNTKNYGEN